MSATSPTNNRLFVVRLLILAAFAALMLYGAAGLPLRGEADSAVNRAESSAGTPVPGHYYVAEAYHDAHTPNMVTVILGDYRGIDTLGEQVVVFTAGLICILILRNFVKRKEDEEGAR